MRMSGCRSSLVPGKIRNEGERMSAQIVSRRASKAREAPEDL